MEAATPPRSLELVDVQIEVRSIHLRNIHALHRRQLHLGNEQTSNKRGVVLTIHDLSKD